jgi:hypothetical protein
MGWQGCQIYGMTGVSDICIWKVEYWVLHPFVELNFVRIVSHFFLDIKDNIPLCDTTNKLGIPRPVGDFVAPGNKCTHNFRNTLYNGTYMGSTRLHSVRMGSMKSSLLAFLCLHFICQHSFMYWLCSKQNCLLCAYECDFGDNDKITIV